MHVIKASNVRDALIQAVQYLTTHGLIEETRAGEALVAQEPVCIHYENPKQHVLLNPVRDANPFFHLMESMWMLAGRDDAAFLEYYIKDFSKMFGKDGIIMDAYGHRWRYGYRYDQLDEIVSQLRKDPYTRQAVLQIWGAGRDDLRAYSSKPCNLTAVFRIQNQFLNMTVYNRSNDLIWGCCGANAVHFSILQEYLAGRIGLPMGQYWQVTNNLHMYTDMYDKMSKRDPNNLIEESLPEPYQATMPLMKYSNQFDDELAKLMKFIDEMHEGNYRDFKGTFHNPFLGQVVMRMALSHCLYKNSMMDDALEIIDTVAADDWKQAGKEWLERRNGR